MRQGGWTLHEMLISLSILGCVMALAAHAARSQLRFFQGTAELSALRAQANHASQIPARALWAVSSTSGDLMIAQDTAIEFHMPIAASFTCESAPGRIAIATATERGNTLASFTETPEAGDRLAALFADSASGTWLTLHVADAQQPGPACVSFPAVPATRTVVLVEPIVVPIGAPLRFMRPVRFSLYRASDSRWFLGMRDWSAESGRLNIVQPVAGPLRAHSLDPEQTGLRFVYRDSSGAELQEPVDPGRVASVTIVSRAASARFEDSSSVTVALRNRP
jgi:type II secretory pathway pseudopilin PulG